MEGSLENICRTPDCTFSQTGVCILNNEPETCLERLASLSEITSEVEAQAGAPVLASPVQMENFSSSLTLTPRDTLELTKSRYCKVVGILGVPNTGKTASLVSLYLLLAHSKLSGFRFLDSKSVMAFEEISRGARRWNEANLPTHLTTHTELLDERAAGYLHLRLESKEDHSKFDLLLTDLPGEWTTTLIDTDRTDRLAFLKSADKIWITVSAEEVAEKKMRQFSIHRLELLLERLSKFLEGQMPDVTIVVTHCDKTESVKNHLEPLQQFANNFKINVVEIASFSSNVAVAPGTGIDKLIKDLIDVKDETTNEFWPNVVSENIRHMLRFQTNT